MGVFKRAWQIWKPLKNHWLLLCFQHWKGQGGALEGPWGVAEGLGTPPRPLGGRFGDLFGVLKKSEASKRRSLEGL